MNPKLPSESRVSHFPQYILHDLLLTLSAKSLVRFKCVCKDWCRMISDPDFEELNFKHTISKILILYRNQMEDDDCGDHYYESFKLDEEGSKATKVSSLYFQSSKLMDSCNSLMLFESQLAGSSHISRLYVFDAINQVKKQLPEISRFCSPNTRRCSLVYDASITEYKVVAFNYTVNNALVDVCIYALNQQEKQWRKYKPPRDQKLVRSCPSVALNGVLYWMAQDYSPEFGVFIQPMEIRTEKFKSVLQLPCEQGNYQLEMKEMKGSLCLLYKSYEYRLDIWILKDSIQNLWIKQHKIAPSEFLDLHFGSLPWLAVERCNGSTSIILTDDGEFNWFDMNNQELIKRIIVESDSVHNSVRDPFALLFIHH